MTDDAMGSGLGAMYAAARHRITDLILSSPTDALIEPCPATPGWRVRDVVAHVRGITEDVAAGNVAGAGTDPWTAAQVARHATTPMSDLLDGWAVDALVLEQFLDAAPTSDPAFRATIDVHSHEYDIRGALARPAPLPAEFATWMLPAICASFFARVAADNLLSVRIVTTEGDRLGPADALITMRTSRFELFRALLGRRSVEQVLAYDWDGVEARPYLRHLFIFGPRGSDLVEASA